MVEKKNSAIIKHYCNRYTLVFTWVVIQSVLFYSRGIVTNLEATKYISEANYFIDNGTLSSGNFWLYSSEIFLIVLSLKLHAGFTLVVIIQLLLNLFSTYTFYKLSKFFLKDHLLAFLATLFFILNIPYQVYNTFLFTESIFYSLAIIFTSYLLRIKKLDIKTLIILVLLLSALMFTRPTGILFMPAAAIFIFFTFFKKVPLVYKALLVVLCSFTFLWLLDQMLKSGGELDFMLPFKKENIICGVPAKENANIKIIEKGNSVKGILYYIANNYDQFLRLAKFKTIAFFGYTRSYYSKIHNLYLILFYYPFYILSIGAIFRNFKKNKPAFFYFLLIILLFWITTLLTCDDWHNRFVLTVSPYFFLMALSFFSSYSFFDKEISEVSERKSLD